VLTHILTDTYLVSGSGHCVCGIHVMGNTYDFETEMFMNTKWLSEIN